MCDLTKEIMFVRLPAMSCHVIYPLLQLGERKGKMAMSKRYERNALRNYIIQYTFIPSSTMGEEGESPIQNTIPHST